jgi:hypothetical protein
MTPKQAEHVAQLLNACNQLQVEHTAESVTQHADNYLFELRNEIVVACAVCRMHSRSTYSEIIPIVPSHVSTN